MMCKTVPLGASVLGVVVGGLSVTLGLGGVGDALTGGEAGSMGITPVSHVGAHEAQAASDGSQASSGQVSSGQESFQPDENPDVAAWIAAGTPGKPHKKLDVLAGSWKAHMVLWPDHKDQRLEAWGRATRQWVLGGRFMQAEFEAKVKGDIYRGIGYFGYDNIRGEYSVLWMDDRSTSTQLEGGTFDDDDVLVTLGTYEDPTTGESISTRHNLTFVNDDKHVLESFMVDASGSATRTLTITYTRRK